MGAQKPALGYSSAPPGHMAPGGHAMHPSPEPHAHTCPALAFTRG